MLLCCPARDCGPKSGNSGIRYSTCTPLKHPQKMLDFDSPQSFPPKPPSAPPPNLHRHRRCRRPPASIFLHLLCTVAQSNGLWMMCQHTSRPAHGRHSRDCGDTRTQRAESLQRRGAVWSAQIKSVPSNARDAPRGCCCCRGIPIKVKTCMLSRLAQKESLQG